MCISWQVGEWLLRVAGSHKGKLFSKMDTALHHEWKEPICLQTLTNHSRGSKENVKRVAHEPIRLQSKTWAFWSMLAAVTRHSFYFEN